MKQAKYKNSNFEAHKKVRKTWPISPITKIVPHKTDNIGSNKEILKAIDDYFDNSSSYSLIEVIGR